MEILVTRCWGGTESTLSHVKVDGAVHQFMLEDIDRGLRQDMPLDEIKRRKVYGKTAIPTGRYRVVINHSTRFKRLLPLLLDVPGFSGIRIHPGNRHVDTEGCLLPGKVWWKEDNNYVVGTSRAASEDLQAKIAAAIARKEEVWITIQNGIKA